MRFWDSSAIVPLLLEEPGTPVVTDLYELDQTIAAWWGTPIECVSAIAMQERNETLRPDEVTEALATLESLSEHWLEVPPVEAVRDSARRMLRVHELRTEDAFQLAAAETLAERAPGTLEFVTLDDRLAHAARREGFRLPL